MKHNRASTLYRQLPIGYKDFLKLNGGRQPGVDFNNYTRLQGWCLSVARRYHRKDNQRARKDIPGPAMQSQRLVHHPKLVSAPSLENPKGNARLGKGRRLATTSVRQTAHHRP